MSDDENCPFCGHDPYHYVDIGVGFQAVAVNCCDLGVALFQHGDELVRRVADRIEALDGALRWVADQPETPPFMRLRIVDVLEGKGDE